MVAAPFVRLPVLLEAIFDYEPIGIAHPERGNGTSILIRIPRNP